ncbi:sensor histidine kinase [Ferruginibacter sp.]
MQEIIMINGIDINYLVIIMVTGAVLLAAVYHTVLFIHRRTTILAHYSMYLWATALFTFYRLINPSSESNNPFLNFLNTDETLQMFAFAMYIRFMGTALDLDQQRDKNAWRFVRYSFYITLCYIAIQVAVVNVTLPHIVYLSLKVLIRIYLLFTGLFMLLAVILKRKKVYYNYLAAGAIVIIASGIISTVVYIVNVKHDFFFNAISWIMMGFFVDVLLFSSAIGYKIKTDALEKEAALSDLIRQNEVLQQKEIEKIQTIYKTKEEERLRIANDLHDDIGASLSSLQIYSAIAEKNIVANPAKTEEMVQRIGKQSKQLLENMNDIVWSMKTAADSSTTLEDKIKNFGVELLTDRDINLTYEISTAAENVLQNIYARKNILLLIKEGMNNIAKYSQAREAKIVMGINSDTLFCCISDDGIGFNNTAATTGNGLKNMQYRVNELSGAMDIITATGAGTTISVIVPIAAVKETV